MSNNYYFFWGGPCSQWAHSPFDEFGAEFNCTEQFMMAAKAKVFGDDETFELIMEEQLPNNQKALGRKVKGFDVNIWNEIARDYVTLGNVNKFIANHTVLEFIHENADTFFVEASPYDKIWGIGMAATDPGINDPKNWKGTNWLGECINNARDIILTNDTVELERLRKELDWR